MPGAGLPCYPDVPCAFVFGFSLSPAALPRFRPETSGDLTRARHRFPCFLLGMNVPYAKAWRCVKKDQIEGSYRTWCHGVASSVELEQRGG